MNISNLYNVQNHAKGSVFAILMMSFNSSSAEQASLVTHADFTFRNGDVHTRAVQVSDGMLLAEGDMILGYSQTLPKHNNRQTLGLSNSAYGRIWPNGLVPYRLAKNLSSDTRRKVTQAIEHWNALNVITMVERTDYNASAYPDFIDFVNDTRCASWIGYQGDGAQSIYTGDKCTTGTMIHEIGHALGLLHEHTRSDRDQFVQINWDNIDPDMHINFEIMDDNILLGDYDFGSIMHYGEYFFSTNGNATIEPIRDTDETIGQRVALSDSDRSSVAELYKSNISLATSSNANVQAGDPVDVDMVVTNNTAIGSNSLTITMPLPADSRLLSYSSTTWSCAQQPDSGDVSCTTPVLPGGAASTLSVSLSATSTPGAMLLDADLTSRSYDTDPSDNNDSVTINVSGTSGSDTVIADVPLQKTNAEDLQIGSAMDAGSGGGSGGGGALNISALIMMLIGTLTLRGGNRGGRRAARIA